MGDGEQPGEGLESGQGAGATGPSGTVEPGQLSALLQKLAHVSESELGAGWDRALHPGAVVGRFELLREVGRGGFGVVWEARDRVLGRLVAFKAVRAGRQEGLREERLLAEAEAVARLSHPNIVSLFDVGQSEHGPYLVLELLLGETLEARLAGGALPPAEALRVGTDIARGLSHAHGLGVVHRDLKPGNVFLCRDGPVKLLDFGLSHALGRRRPDGGTPAYMAPEQREGAPEDERSDVFALGAILFRMLSGRLPFRADDGGKELTSARPAPGLEVPELPGLGELIGRMLEKEPTRRPRDGAEVLAALQALAPAPEARSGPAPPVRVRRRLRWRLPALVALGAAAGLLATWWWRRPPPPTPLDASGRVVVAVADVENRTGEATLDALTGLLVTSLEQSRRLLVLTRSRMLDLARQEGRRAERVDEVLGRDLGRRAGARVLLVPVVHRLGGTYALELRAVDPAKDQHLFAAREQVPDQAGLLGAIDRLSDRTRRELQESESDVAAKRIQVGEAVTRSLEAYQHYLRGLELRITHCDMLEDAREQRQALEHDPDFGAAHMELANALGWASGDYSGDVAEHFQRAWAQAERMPEKERLVLQLDPYLTPAPPGKDPASGRSEMLRLAGELEARFPADKSALHVAALAFRIQGAFERSVLLYRRALALDPGQCFITRRLTETLVLGERPGDAEEVARDALAARPGPWNEANLAWALTRRDTLVEAVAHARAALAADDGRNLLVAVRAACPLLAAGMPEDVEAAHLRLAQNNERSGRGRFPLAVRALALEGRVHELRRLLASVRSDPASWPLRLYLGAGRPRTDAPEALAAAHEAPESAERAALVAFYGDVAGAADVARALPEASAAARLVEAASWLAEGNAGLAANGLAAVPGHGALAAPSQDRARGSTGALDQVPLLLLAEALLAGAKPAESLEVLVRLPLRWSCAGLTLVHRGRISLMRAEALEQLGRRAEALAEVDALLALWKRADPDLPLLAEAKARRARLAAAVKAAR